MYKILSFQHATGTKFFNYIFPFICVDQAFEVWSSFNVSRLKCATSIKYTPDFKSLVNSYVCLLNAMLHVAVPIDFPVTWESPFLTSYRYNLSVT